MSVLNLRPNEAVEKQFLCSSHLYRVGVLIIIGLALFRFYTPCPVNILGLYLDDTCFKQCKFFYILEGPASPVIKFRSTWRTRPALDRRKYVFNGRKKNSFPHEVNLPVSKIEKATPNTIQHIPFYSKEDEAKNLHRKHCLRLPGSRLKHLF